MSMHRGIRVPGRGRGIYERDRSDEPSFNLHHWQIAISVAHLFTIRGADYLPMSQLFLHAISISYSIFNQHSKLGYISRSYSYIIYVTDFDDGTTAPGYTTSANMTFATTTITLLPSTGSPDRGIQVARREFYDRSKKRSVTEIIRVRAQL